MVGAGQVVIDGFADADADHFIAMFAGVFDDAVDGVHRVVAADHKEIADVVFLKLFKDRPEMFILKLQAGGA